MTFQGHITHAFEKKGASKDHWIYLMRHIMELGWVGAFNRLDKETLFISDKVFLTKLQSQRVRLQESFITPAQIPEVDFGDFNKILVFLQEDEACLVEKLKKQFPNKLIVSGMHQFSLVNKERQARLKVLRSKPKPCQFGPRIIISTPNSGAEYYASSLGENGLLQPWEYIGRPFITLSALYEGISFSELIKNVEDRYKTNDGIAYLFNTDVLLALLKNTSFTIDQFVDWINERNGTVLTCVSENHLSQACAAGLLKSTFSRSIWTVKKEPKWNFTLESMERQNVYPALFGIAEGEKLIDKLKNKLKNAEHITFEDGLQDVGATFFMISKLFNIPLPAAFSPLKYEQNFWLSNEAQKIGHQVKSDMVDTFGLSL